MALFKITHPDNFIEVGDLVEGYYSGYWKVVKIERRTSLDGSIANSLIHMKKVANDDFRPINGKKIEELDAYYLTSLTKDKILEIKQNQIKKISDGYDFLFTLAK